MKSEKVKEFIDGHVKIRSLSFTAADIEYCTMLAEQEAEERMRAKAISAFDDMWLGNGGGEFDDEFDDEFEFEPDYEYHRKNFIQKLTEE